ncbi:hypothetical protein OH77DRAFT_1432534 [Trametes cingulata]|nr:hypothetical protein OH77DRAFT_1432534 [Trametes cingulata]
MWNHAASLALRMLRVTTAFTTARSETPTISAVSRNSHKAGSAFADHEDLCTVMPSPAPANPAQTEQEELGEGYQRQAEEWQRVRERFASAGRDIVHYTGLWPAGDIPAELERNIEFLYAAHAEAGLDLLCATLRLWETSGANGAEGWGRITAYDKCVQRRGDGKEGARSHRE